MTQHLDYRQVLGLTTVPHRTTLSRRYQTLYPIPQDFIAFVGQYAEDLDPAFDSHELYEDKSLFKAQTDSGGGQCADLFGLSHTNASSSHDRQ
ncbi:MAG: hypothetical protein OEU26_17495 [Candidatus Tectomicrobia bacterium]|nr:hypothetical protein [Candidatus Tectomicrobia bacterium]